MANVLQRGWVVILLMVALNAFWILLLFAERKELTKHFKKMQDSMDDIKHGASKDSTPVTNNQVVVQSTPQKPKDPREFIWSSLVDCNPDQSTFKSYEQYAWISKNLWNKFFHNKCGGVFVDVGAYNGLLYSNSKFFETHVGFTGICIEPLPQVFKKLVELRPQCINYNIGLGDVNKVMNYIELKGNEKEPIYDMGSCFEEFCQESHKKAMAYFLNGHGTKSVIPIPVRKLKDVLNDQKIKVVDFLSLDCEGCERKILDGIDWENHVFRYILSEHRGLGDFLKEKGYKFLGNGEWGPDYLYELQAHGYPKHYIDVVGQKYH